MAEILGAGVTHAPGLLCPPETQGEGIVRATRHKRAPVEWADNPPAWPAPLREEFGDDNGVRAGVEHRARIGAAYHKVRDAIDAFKPDLVVVFADDQWENFNDDLVPAFAVYAYDEVVSKPFGRMYVGPGDNYWGEPKDKEFVYKGHREAGIYLTNKLIEAGFDMPYGYRPLHAAKGLAHGHANTMVLLDDERKGWPYATIYVHINCHGERFVAGHGVGGFLPEGVLPDPMSPTPKRCFELGQATARILKEGPWRTVIVGSSSWSHGSLTAKHHFVYPDVEMDRRRLEHLKAGDFTHFRDIPGKELDESGENEMRNWCALLGAMHESGNQMEFLDWAESWIFNSSKALALFHPSPVGSAKMETAAARR